MHQFGNRHGAILEQHFDHALVADAVDFAVIEAAGGFGRIRQLSHADQFVTHGGNG